MNQETEIHHEYKNRIAELETSLMTCNEKLRGMEKNREQNYKTISSAIISAIIAIALCDYIGCDLNISLLWGVLVFVGAAIAVHNYCKGSRRISSN